MAIPAAGGLPRHGSADWPATLLRLFLIAAGVIWIAAVAAKLVLYFVSELGMPPVEMQGLDDVVHLGLSGAVLVLAAAAPAAARLLGTERRRSPAATVAVVGGVAAGAALAVLDMRPSLTMMAGQLSAISFQLWSAWPLAVWPAAGTAGTVLLGLVAGNSRWMGVAWASACILISAFALTYLLPADDQSVAGLHGLGLVRLPRDAGWVETRQGAVVQTRDADPMIFVQDGTGGYVTAVFAGDYTIREMCITQIGLATQTLPDARVNIHVGLGTTTVVPDRCQTS